MPDRDDRTKRKSFVYISWFWLPVAVEVGFVLGNIVEGNPAKYAVLALWLAAAVFSTWRVDIHAR